MQLPEFFSKLEIKFRAKKPYLEILQAAFYHVTRTRIYGRVRALAEKRLP